MAKPATLPKAKLPTDIDSLAAVVLGSLPGATDAMRDDVRAGDHEVDLTLTVRVQGILKVGAATTTVQVNKLKPWNLCKLLANHVPREVLDDCINQALAAARADEKSDPAVVSMEAEADDLKARVEAVFEQAGQTVVKPRRGNVALHGEVSVSVEEA